jgi:phosphoenolpyruvate-protein kinase (PTS system EI component)
MLESLSDDTLRERAADIRQVGRRVLERIARTGTSADPPTRFVLVAAELGPADLLEHLGQGLVAAVGVRGGANSHAAIVARSVGIPLVTGVHPQILDLPDSTPLLVDADAGVVLADPPDAEVARADGDAARAGARRAILRAERDRSPVTADGQPFGLLCNVASDTEIRAGRDSGATGAGLLRTELPFLHAERWPTESDHRRALRPILAEASGWPVTVRLLDFANDKIPPFLIGGVTGLRALLDHPAALTAQLRAVADLGRAVQLQIMVPMVTAAAELRTVRSAIDAVAAELGAAPVPVGAMVETVAAVEAIGELCAAADFLSIGTNDLTAQLLDLDRTDPRGRPELTADPRVLALIARVVAAATAAGRPVSVCGDAGTHPTTLPLLLGAGVRQFSVACARIDETRYRLHRLDARDCAKVFADALRQPDAAQAAALVHDRIGVALP